MSRTSSTARLPPVLSAHATARSCQTGEVVFRAGAPAGSVFHVAAGSVSLLRFGRCGEEVTVHQAQAGEYFAEASLYSESYHCSAVATQPSRLLVIPAEALRRLLARDIAFSQLWVEILSKQLRRSRARVERLCLKGARERVMHLLLAEGEGADHRYQLPGTLKNLASELGLTHEALYRTLAAMEAEGVLVRGVGQLALA